MILIESVKFREVDGPIATVGHFDEDAPNEIVAGNIPRGCDYITETVLADRFKDMTGRVFEIGMTKQVRDVLGLPMDVFRRQQEALVKQGDDNRNLRKNLNGHMQMPWRRRLLFLFKGAQTLGGEL